jgi:hypothetical protein
MRVSAAGRTSAVPTAARGPSVYGIANKGGRIREIGVVNTTAVAVAVGIARASAAGTQGAGLTEVVMDNELNGVIQLTAFNTHTADATVGAVIRQITLGAAAGSGWVFAFGEEGLVIPQGTANGIVIVCPTGTGQHLDFWFDWEE